jgi:hypothetical protein
MKKSRSKFLKIVDEKHDINFHWPYIRSLHKVSTDPISACSYHRRCFLTTEMRQVVLLHPSIIIKATNYTTVFSDKLRK